MPGKVPKRADDSFGSLRFPPRQAMCPACDAMTRVMVQQSGALKGRIVIEQHSSRKIVGKPCLGSHTRVILPHEVKWPAAA